MQKSFRQIDLHNGQPEHGPKYQQLRQYLVDELRAGRLKPGQAMPTELQLAGMHDISRTTVRQAMADMERDGLIRRIQGKGTFVKEEAQARLRRRLAAFALIVPETLDGYYPSLLQGFQAASAKVHHQVLVCSTQNDLTKQAEAILQLVDKEVAGVAMVPSPRAPTPPYQVRQLQKHGIPVVFCHRRVKEVRAPLLMFPFRQVGRIAGEALARQGHRRVAIFIHRASDASREYEAGLRTAMRANGGDLNEQFIYYGSPETPGLVDQEEAIQEALKRMLAMPNRPTGIMTSFDSVGEMVYLMLGRLGMKVPEEVSLVSFGGTRRDSSILRLLTSVAVDEMEIGRRAAAILNEMSRGQRSPEDEEEIVMPLILSGGETLGPAPDNPRILAP